MNGRTAKMIRKNASLSGFEKKEARGMKRRWQNLPGNEKALLRRKMTKVNGQLAMALKMKHDIERNRSVRRHTMADGTKVLWFMSDTLPGEASIYMMSTNGADVWMNRTSKDVPDYGIDTIPPVFNKFWEFATEDTIPLPHFNRLHEFASAGLGALA